jgi:hypothetical protein
MILRTRTVLVIGRTASDRAVDGFDLTGHHTLVLVTLGWPMTDVQRGSVHRTIERCLAKELSMEAILAPEPVQALEEVRSDDEVHLFAHRREIRALERRFFAAGLVPVTHRS